MTIVKPTVTRVLRIWFAITIRALILGVAAAIVAAVIISIFVFATGGGQAEIERYAQLAGPAIGFPVSLYAAFVQIGRKCGDVRLVLVQAE
jgi:hypothetical protein